MTAPVPVPDGTTPPAEALEAAEAALDAHGSWGLHDTDDGFQCTGCHEVFASLTEWRSHRTRRIAADVVAALRLLDRDRETAAKADNLRPIFGNPVTDWYRWFAWHPVETADRGWRWLCPVWRRRIEKHHYLDGGADRWFQHAARRTP